MGGKKRKKEIAEYEKMKKQSDLHINFIQDMAGKEKKTKEVNARKTFCKSIDSFLLIYEANSSYNIPI